ncbi:MAG: glucose dehydrogenase, partial [Planctomycetaceae bacterium]
SLLHISRGLIAGGMGNPQELAFNDYGDLFTGDNNSDSGDKARIVQVVAGADSGWRMYYQYLSDRGPFNREKIWHPHHEEQAAYIVPPIANFADGPSGLAFDPGTGVDPSVRGKFFLCDFGGGTSNSGIRSFRLEADGAFHKLAESEQTIWNVMATDVAFGPDGMLWISDWVQGWEGVGKGRLYRVTGPGFDSKTASEVSQILRSDFPLVDVEKLVSYLSHADRRVRNEATWELARRGNVGALEPLVLGKQHNRLARLHAIWGIEQVVRKAPEPTAAMKQASVAVSSLVSDADEFVRAAAAQYVGQHGDVASASTLRPLLGDPSLRVRSYAALALTEAAKRKVQVPELTADCVAMLAENDNHDPVVRHAGAMLLAAIGNVEAIVALKDHANLSVRRAAVVALRRIGSDRIDAFLKDASPLVSLEAARAIHDAPIPAALASLAIMIDDASVADDAMLRRVLNANYRLGTKEHAEALAAYAARPIAPVALRLEAIEMLAAWETPDPRDRVLGDYRPLTPRAVSIAIAALGKSLPAILQNSDDVRDAAVSVAARYGMSQVTPFLEQRVADRNLRPEARATALRSLARLQPDKAAATAITLLDASQVLLRIAAFETLAAVNPAIAVAPLTKATTSESMIERQAAWDALAKIDSAEAHLVIMQGLKSYLDGKLPADTTLNVLEAVGPWLKEDMAKSLADHQAKLESENPLGKWWASLEGGNSAAGAVVFNKTQLSCVRCHRVDRIGGEVGPVLTVVGKERDRRYLLESICLPDAAIAKGFETAVIADDSGQIYTGIIRGEADDMVELIAADGSIHRIDQESIVGRKRGKSAMPEELTKYMTPRELRDLVAYLVSLQVDPRAANAKE